MEGPASGSLLLDRLIFAVQEDEAARITASDDPIERRAIEAVKNGDARSYDYLVSKYMKRVVSIASSSASM